MTNPLPAADWAEDVRPDEAGRHRVFADQISAMQTKLNAKYGPGRAFHRQQVAAVTGELTVPVSEPELRRGLFAQPGSYSAVIRLSHGAVAPHADAVPDIQGFAISVRGIDGPGALAETTHRQDFLLINLPAFGFATSAEFAQIVAASARGQAALAKDLLSRKGPVGGSVELARLTSNVSRPFLGFATTTFHSAAPIAFGPYATKVRLVPVGAGRNLRALLDHRGDLGDRLRDGALAYDLQVQFYVNDSDTPLEDMRRAWPERVSPFRTVARLTIPQQDIDSTAGRQLEEQVEHDRFDPWNALADHRPLGEIMRARKAAYYPSVVNRGAAD